MGKIQRQPPLTWESTLRDCQEAGSTYKAGRGGEKHNALESILKAARGRAGTKH